MTIEGNKVPNVTFKVRELNKETAEYEWTHPNTDWYFAGKRVIVFSLPGAFTPTCSTFQVPGFEARYDDFVKEGIDDIYCMSCNDSFVMNAWAKDQGVKKVKFIPDGSCEFTAGMDMLVAKDNVGFGKRSWRYAMIVNDGVVEKVFEEPGKSDDCADDPYGETSPGNILAFLQGTLEN
jgi:peroxiredoxin